MAIHFDVSQHISDSMYSIRNSNFKISEFYFCLSKISLLSLGKWCLRFICVTGSTAATVASENGSCQCTFSSLFILSAIRISNFLNFSNFLMILSGWNFDQCRSVIDIASFSSFSFPVRSSNFENSVISRLKIWKSATPIWWNDQGPPVENKTANRVRFVHHRGI